NYLLPCCTNPELTVQFTGNLKDFKDSDVEEWVQQISPFKFLHIRKKPEDLDASIFFHGMGEETYYKPDNINKKIKFRAAKYYKKSSKQGFITILPHNEPALVPPYNESALVPPYNEPASVFPYNEPALVSPLNEPVPGSPYNEPASGSSHNESALISLRDEPALVQRLVLVPDTLIHELINRMNELEKRTEALEALHNNKKRKVIVIDD
ncbi:11648_t:CDS:2, partial [Dentiscutata heterogama]